MASGGIGRVMATGTGMTKNITKAKSIGQGLVGRAGVLFSGLKALEMYEQYTDLNDDMAKLKTLEASLTQRIVNAEETLENAKRLPMLSNSGSMQQLEATIGQIRKYLQWLASCGPMLRGVSKHEVIPKLGRLGGFLTDALVALQMDATLALASGNGMGSMLPHQVAPQIPQRGYNHFGGEPPAGQMLQSLDQYGNTSLVGQHNHQRLLMPLLAYHPQQQMVPAGGIYGGVPPTFPDPTVRIPPQVARTTLAGPTHFAGWPESSEILPAMTHRQAVGLVEPIGFERTGWLSRPYDISPMATRSQTPTQGRTDPNHEQHWPSGLADVSPTAMHTTSYSARDTPIDFGEAGSPRNSDDADFPTMDNTSGPAAVDTTTSSDGSTRQLDPPSMTPPSQVPSPGATTGYEREAWTNFGDPYSFRSLAATAVIGSDGTISPTPFDPVPQTTSKKTPGARADSSKRPSDYVSQATKQLRGALGIDGAAWSDGLDSSLPHSRRQKRAEWPNLSNHHLQATQQMPGVLKPQPQICYDSAGWPYYLDADTGQCYPAGWKRDGPKESLVASRGPQYG